ncbi:cytochrome ubiquinol oxidase subunit I [Actinocorallia populi]|uniref:cytochrome ubiquinol oxidase subunit I n=1 Tax=Actinocorallia populi TaxID=2079200 RepID=UPI000D0903DD|nr:cytochrome ubiquinol oxidase subunit I [Actinocorallia populi]
MDGTVLLARLQFALTAGSHFLFVALTLGLVTLVALLQTRAALTRSELHARMVRFWGGLYVINYAMGIITGLVMEFQFGMNWTGLLELTGGVFGVPLALETIGAFFIESTFLGLWIFGWDRFSRWAHLAMIWVVALTAYASAFFILVANGWMQRPVGYVMENGHARLSDLGAILTNPTALLAFGHVVFAAFLTAGLFMAAVSAYHLWRKTAETEFFRRGLRTGMLATMLSVMPVAVFGGMQFGYLQDTKRPELVSPLALTGEVLMLLAWQGMAVMALVFLVKFLYRPRRFGRVFLFTTMAALPLPYLAMISGWIYREIGRQPWAVTGLLRVEDAVAPLSRGEAWSSFGAFVSLFAVLATVNFWLLFRHARRGPQRADAPRAEPATLPVPTF